MANRKLTPAQEARAVHLATFGLIAREIAPALGVSKSCVQDALRRLRGEARHPSLKPAPPPGGWPDDLGGLPFFNLTVVSKTTRPPGVRCGTYYRCRCACGKETVVQRANLISGNTKGCGCSAGKRTFLRPAAAAV